MGAFDVALFPIRRSFAVLAPRLRLRRAGNRRFQIREAGREEAVVEEGAIGKADGASRRIGRHAADTERA
jgi:hypothetical protein